MSYCRFSCDDHRSDVYAYEHCAYGYTIHVASSRVIFAEPLPPVVPYDKDHVSEYVERQRKVTQLMGGAKYVPIELPHVGETFHCDTPGECADQLLRLRALGYHVPQYAIDRLLEEAAEGQA